jgi:predicted RNA binding protein YcfA (HicA-like mRNA interferase family)
VRQPDERTENLGLGTGELVGFARGRKGDWEAICINLDIAVQGGSFAEVQDGLRGGRLRLSCGGRGGTERIRPRGLANKGRANLGGFALDFAFDDFDISASPRPGRRGLGGDLSDSFDDVKFSAFVEVLAAHGFSLHRQGSGSHAIYRGVVSGEVRLVVVAAHRKRLAGAVLAKPGAGVVALDMDLNICVYAYAQN